MAASEFKRGEQVVVVEDNRIMLNAPPENVGLLNGRIGSVERAWPVNNYLNVIHSYDVRVGKDIYMYAPNSLRRPSPLEILARAAE